MLLGFAAMIVKGSIRVLYNGNWKHEVVGLFQWLLSASSRRRSLLALWCVLIAGAKIHCRLAAKIIAGEDHLTGASPGNRCVLRLVTKIETIRSVEHKTVYQPLLVRDGIKPIIMDFISFCQQKIIT